MRRVLIVLVAIFCLAATWAQPKSAKLSFERESHDFGRVLRGEGDVSVEFRFTNEGTAPLVVKKATTTCSCTTVEFSKKPIMPGKQGTIRIIYSPNKLPAETFHKAIKVFSNDPRGMQIITIHGESVD